MQPDVLISFVVPVYNAAGTLGRCLDSILAQRGAPYEIIAVDDASADGSLEVLRQYERAYPAVVQVSSQPNGGPGEARNLGIRQARGRYVAFVDSDDTLAPGYLPAVEALLHTHDPDLLVLSYDRVYRRKKSVFERGYAYSRWTLFDTPLSVATHPELVCKIEGAAWLKIVRRAWLTADEALFFGQGRMAEDLEASLKWLLSAEKIVVTGQKLYAYNIYPGSLNAATDALRRFIDVQATVCGHYQARGQFGVCFAELECVFAKHLLLSSLLRLWSADGPGKYALFLELRAALLAYFPKYHHNKYLRAEPLHARLALYLTAKCPWVLRWLLRT